MLERGEECRGLRNQEMIAALCLRCVAAKMRQYFEDIKGNTPSNRALRGTTGGGRNRSPGLRAGLGTLTNWTGSTSRAEL